jgi:hypothetical protein
MKRYIIFAVLAFAVSTQAQVNPTLVHGHTMGESSEIFVRTFVPDCKDERTFTEEELNSPLNRLSHTNLSCEIYRTDFINARTGKRTSLFTRAGKDFSGMRTWTFEHDRLVHVELKEYEALFFDVFRLQAIEQYGEPKEEHTTEFQNGFGARYTTKHARWVCSDGTAISLDQWPPDQSSGWMTIMTFTAKEDQPDGLQIPKI